MARAKALLIRINRVSFYRLHSEEFFEHLFLSQERELGEGAARNRIWPRLSPQQQGLHAWWTFWGDVLNGGLAQYFYNFTDAEVPALVTLLKAAKATPLADLLPQAVKVYRKHKKAFAVANPFGEDGLFSQMTELQKLDRPIVNKLNTTAKLLEAWVRKNIAEIAVGDDGEPIDPAFTGKIETRHENGRVFEEAEVRKGVLTGSYRRFAPDGTLEHAAWYKAGQESTDFWPTGQPRYKEMKRGKLKIKEWYFPSGQVLKRYVVDKTGYAVEPVRLWHENGQLAEEIHTKTGDRIGPWTKFFEDGSPRLEAEYRSKQLIVRNAWNDEGVQIVKDGRGTYTEDEWDYDTSYSLRSENYWRRTYDVREGIPHGPQVTYVGGVLWSREQYEKGKLHGEQVVYHDNGRIQSRTIFQRGKAGKPQTFPKFDNPVPAVVIEINADEKHYTAWKEPLLDVYPTPRNLRKVQARAAVPEFLWAVHEKNQAGTVPDGHYEYVDDFDDGIGYALFIDAAGRVADVQFNAASAYSGAVIDDYPPLLKTLEFKPGRRNGKKVPSRAVAHVRHTFVEGPAKR